MRDDYGKLWFNIIDYTGSATRMFADPAFDGDPVREDEEVIDEEGEVVEEREIAETAPEPDDFPDGPDGPVDLDDEPETGPRKFYFDGGQVEIAGTSSTSSTPTEGSSRAASYTDYAAEKVRTLCPTAPDAARPTGSTPNAGPRSSSGWTSGASDFDDARRGCRSSPTPTPSTCSATSPSTRRCAPAASGRERLRKDTGRFLDRFGPEAREVLDELLEKYAEHGDAQFVLPDVLEVPPFTDMGNVDEIAARFGGAEQLRSAVTELQTPALRRLIEGDRHWPEPPARRLRRSN